MKIDRTCMSSSSFRRDRWVLERSRSLESAWTEQGWSQDHVVADTSWATQDSHKKGRHDPCISKEMYAFFWPFQSLQQVQKVCWICEACSVQSRSNRWSSLHHSYQCFGQIHSLLFYLCNPDSSFALSICQRGLRFVDITVITMIVRLTWKLMPNTPRSTSLCRPTSPTK